MFERRKETDFDVTSKMNLGGIDHCMAEG